MGGLDGGGGRWDRKDGAGRFLIDVLFGIGCDEEIYRAGLWKGFLYYGRIIGDRLGYFRCANQIAWTG